MLSIAATAELASNSNSLGSLHALNVVHDQHLPVCKLLVQLFFLNALLTYSRYRIFTYLTTSLPAVDLFHASPSTS